MVQLWDGFDQNWHGHTKSFKSSIACLADILMSCKISDQLVGYMSLGDGELVLIIGVEVSTWMSHRDMK